VRLRAITGLAYVDQLIMKGTQVTQVTGSKP